MIKINTERTKNPSRRTIEQPSYLPPVHKDYVQFPHVTPHRTRHAHWPDRSDRTVH